MRLLFCIVIVFYDRSQKKSVFLSDDIPKDGVRWKQHTRPDETRKLSLFLFDKKMIRSTFTL